MTPPESAGRTDAARFRRTYAPTGEAGSRVPARTDSQQTHRLGTPLNRRTGGTSRTARSPGHPPGCRARADRPGRRNRPERPHAAPDPRAAVGAGEGLQLVLTVRGVEAVDQPQPRRLRGRADDRAAVGGPAGVGHLLAELGLAVFQIATCERRANRSSSRRRSGRPAGSCAPCPCRGRGSASSRPSSCPRGHRGAAGRRCRPDRSGPSTPRATPGSRPRTVARPGRADHLPAGGQGGAVELVAAVGQQPAGRGRGSADSPEWPPAARRGCPPGRPAPRASPRRPGAPCRPAGAGSPAPAGRPDGRA